MPIVTPAGPTVMDFLFALCLSEHIVCHHLVQQEALKQLPSSQGMNNTYDSLRGHAVGCWGEQAPPDHPQSLVCGKAACKVG